MAYGVKYRFEAESINGATYRIDILKKDYSGTVTVRPLGRSPQLKREQAGHIFGTSLEIWAECQVDGEFSSLYTSDPQEYRVNLYGDDTLVWTGFVSPELYSEPDIAPPYDVQIVAVDGLGELKLTNWTDTGQITLRGHISALLALTGLELTLDAGFFGMLAEGSSALDVSCEFSHLDGSTNYEVLEAILATLNASITQQNGTWLLYREADLNFTSFRELSMRKRMGSATSYPYWPVGQMESEVVPARKTVIVQCPNRYRESMLDNPHMSSDNGWHKINGTVFASSDGYTGYYLTPTAETGMRPGISQAILNCRWSNVLQLDVDVWLEQQYGALQMEKVGILVTHTVGGTVYYLRNVNGEELYEWTTASVTNSKEFDAKPCERSSPETYSVVLPPSNNSGTLTIRIENVPHQTSVGYVYGRMWAMGANLGFASQITGLQLNLNIDNNARGSGDIIESAFSNAGEYELVAPAQRAMSGVPVIDGSPAMDWSTAVRFPTAQDYIALLAMDNALLVALPRLRKKGKINIPASGCSDMPLFFYDGALNFIVKTFEWDLVNCEFACEMLNAAAASITVESQTTQRLPDGGGASRATTGGGGGGGGTSDFNQLTNRPKYNGVEMTNATNIPEVKTTDWDNKIDKPSGGSTGQYLRKTSTGTEWANVSGGDDTKTYLISHFGIETTTNPGQSNGKYLMGAGVDPRGRYMAEWVDIEVFSGNYNDLYNKPTLFSGDYDDLSNKPTLFSGNYNDLSHKPNLSSYVLKSDFGDELIARLGIDGCEMPVSNTGVLKRTTGYKAQWVDLDGIYHPYGGDDALDFDVKGITLHNAYGDSVTLDIDSNGYLRINGNAYTTGTMNAGGRA